MKRLLQMILVSLIPVLTGCIGTDLIDDPVINEKLTLLPRIDTLPIGAEQVFTVKYSNQYGVEEMPGPVDWRSSDPGKIEIDDSGKARVWAAGEATLYVTTGLLSDSIVLNRANGNPGIPDTSFFKQGVFVPVSNSYSAKGKVFVQTIDGISQIITGADFSTSPGPSLYLLLANHTNGSYSVISGGHAINALSAQITANKLSTFSGIKIWEVPAGVDPADYDYVVLYCVLGPVFGTAVLQ